MNKSEYKHNESTSKFLLEAILISSTTSQYYVSEVVGAVPIYGGNGTSDNTGQGRGTRTSGGLVHTAGEHAGEDWGNQSSTSHLFQINGISSPYTRSV